MNGSWLCARKVFAFQFFALRSTSASRLNITKSASILIINNDTNTSQKRSTFTRNNRSHTTAFTTTNCCICVQQQRFASNKDKQDKVKPPLKPFRYALKKLVDFITDSKYRLEDKLEKRMPNVFQVYKTFNTGVKSFVVDTKDFYQMTQRLWKGESLRQLSRKELELYVDFSKDLPIIGLMMIIAFAPGGLFAFPIAYVFPRYLLSHHFWTPQQKNDFRRLKIKKKLQHYDKVVNFLELLSQHTSSKNETDMLVLIFKLDNAVHLSKEEILDKLPLFAGKPYRMESLSIRHWRHVAKANHFPLRKKKLIQYALLLHYTDMAMKKEGINNLTNDELARACYKRGLNYEGVDRYEQIQYLEKWLSISSHIEENNISLLLHLPVLLGYTWPSNRELMGPLTTRTKF